MSTTDIVTLYEDFYQVPRAEAKTLAFKDAYRADDAPGFLDQITFSAPPEKSLE